MLPSNINLKIKTGTVGYNNKILVSDEKFSLGKNKNVNALVLGPMDQTSKEEPVTPMPNGHPSHKVVAQETQAKKPTTHADEKIALVIFLSDGFTICNIFR